MVLAFHGDTVIIDAGRVNALTKRMGIMRDHAAHHGNVVRRAIDIGTLTPRYAVESWTRVFPHQEFERMVGLEEERVWIPTCASVPIVMGMVSERLLVSRVYVPIFDAMAKMPTTLRFALVMEPVDAPQILMWPPCNRFHRTSLA